MRTIRTNVSQARSHHPDRVVVLGATLMLATGTSVCNALKGRGSSDTSAPHTITPGKTPAVSMSFYPIQYLAESTGGKLVRVSTVTPSNVEPYDFELSGKEIIELGKADIIAYVPGFQPSLDKAAKGVGSGPIVIDLSKLASLAYHKGAEEKHECGEEATDGASASVATTIQASEAKHDEHGHDEHTKGGKGHDSDLGSRFWLDPGRTVKVTETLETSFAKIDLANADGYKTGLSRLKMALIGVNNQCKQGLTSCRHKTFITSHAVFDYMAERYDLTQALISGIDPEVEPSPAEVVNIKLVVEKTGVKTISTEELVSDVPARVIAAETGVETSVLNPLESKPERGGYIDAMTISLEWLKPAMAYK